ncbi:NB-ARC domain-containing protein [Heracleum sosnowskyi]|uniref:NB-ARC domain-containing protein n=1 Tax=Heracleum sosnowskyi TaxID=360622 RepID=A0AAD8HNP1_9APIA|nr:NB-ARC domain-containing protein [Heracleum sosnowskyi]
MADAVVTDLAAGLVRKLVSLATQEVIQAWNLNEDLETLRERLETIDALLSDADTKMLTMPTVRNWFNKLEDVAHVADVFIDELAYQVTRRKVENRRKVLDFFVPSKNNTLYRFKVAHKIKSIHTSFDKIFKWAGDLGLQPLAHLYSVVQQKEIRNTPPCEDESKIVGRVSDMSYLVHTLCKNHQENLSVIAVVGMGGQGKTTLARMVYNRDVVIDTFPKRMWVTVSDDFDFMNILNEMVVSLTSTNSKLKNADGLIKDLQKQLKGVKYLLILDDVWNDQQEKWDKLMNSLHGVGGAKGSRILITTRNQEVVNAVQCYDFHRVEQLSEDDSWALFKQRAFSYGGVSETEEFDALGKKMVKRCGGLPLAIKTLGSLLHSKKSEKEWLLIQNSEIWKSKGIFASLRLSYDNLPCSSLKRCFAYCSILPKDFKIYKDKLVLQWMSLGFILPPKNSNMLMEDIGNEYFNILLWNSLLQDVKKDEYGDIIYCKMHDLVHDLALELSKHHFITATDDHELNHMSKAIYVRFNEGLSGTKPKITRRNFERVQVLYAETNMFHDVLPYFNHLTTLVLEVKNDGLPSCEDELPCSVANMKYLKYLDISSFSKSYRLPSYITRLYNLQTLILPELNEIPTTLCNLINLRHFVIRHKFASAKVMFTGIERLISLQTLPHFVVSRDHNCHIGQLGELNNLRGKLKLYGLSDIESMEEARKAKLHEKPNIQRLWMDWNNNKDEREEIVEYNDEDVMEGLKPHTNLKELIVKYFKGKKLASWITMMTNLVRIDLGDCNICEGLPSLGQLPKLREIMISRMHSLKVIGSDLRGSLSSRSIEFTESWAAKTVTTTYPSLTKLHLWDLPNLEEWLEPVMSRGDEDQSTMLAFPKLEEMTIEKCPKLTRIPYSCFPSLKKLGIQDLDSSSLLLETLRRIVSASKYLKPKDISDGEGICSSSTSNVEDKIEQVLRNNSLSLTSLTVNNCKGLTCLTLGAPLEKLEVFNCPNLTSIKVLEDSGAALIDLSIGKSLALSEWVFAQSVSSTLVRLTIGPSLEELDKFSWQFSSSPSSVISFPNLTWLSLYGWVKAKSIVPTRQIDDSLCSTFPALSYLYITDFGGLKALPDSLALLPSLTSLSIFNCENLESLPAFDESHSLQQLSVFRCPILAERCSKGSGPEWFKIQHIPTTWGSTNTVSLVSSIRKRVRGLLNKLSECNIEAIKGKLPQYSVMLSTVLVPKLSLLRHVAVCAPFVAGMSCMVGIEFGAKLLASLARASEVNALYNVQGTIL